MYAEALTSISATQLTGSINSISTEELVEQTLSQDPIQRYYAAKTVASLGPVDSAFVPALHHLLQDEEFNVRLAACYALSAMGREAMIAVTGLCHLLKDKTIGVRQSAAYALHALSPLPQSTHRSLTLALADFNPKVREHAAAALASSQPKGVYIALALRDALFDPVEAVS
ncbi:MAG: HEAT repeat domain-containing protein [Gammaproteobacteria bacterium]|nr:HEAT repeat domain-containing protein [Gammaproteobacteria bacterium]